MRCFCFLGHAIPHAASTADRPLDEHAILALFLYFGGRARLLCIGWLIHTALNSPSYYMIQRQLALAVAVAPRKRDDSSLLLLFDDGAGLIEARAAERDTFAQHSGRRRAGRV